MTLKERLHRLVDGLPRREMSAAERYLEYLQFAGSDPVIEAMRRAPIDDEPLTARDKRALERGRREAAAGSTLSDAEVRRRLRK